MTKKSYLWRGTVFMMLTALMFAIVMALVFWASGNTPCAYAQTASCPAGSTTTFSDNIGIQGGTTFTMTIDGSPTAARTLTLPDATTTFVGTDTTQTLTNKTLGATTVTGAVTFNDNVNATFGTGSDATIDYNGSDLVINPQAVGSGRVNVAGVVVFNDESADPNVVGEIQRNGNDVKIYSGGAARNFSRVPLTAVKTSNQVVNNTTTHTNATELNFSVGSSERWGFIVYAEFDSAIAADIDFAWSIPSGTTGTWVTNGSNTQIQTVESSGEVNCAGLSVGIVSACNMQGQFLTGGSSGTMQLTFAQQSATTSDTTLHDGSYIIAWKLN